MEDDSLQSYRDEFKVPLSCRACDKLMYNWDTKFFYKYAVCAECYVDWLEGREFSDEFFKDRKGVIEYVKEKILEKTSKK